MKIVRSLLIVDDNEGDIFLCKELLKAFAPGCFPNILTASDGQEALEMFANYEESRNSDPVSFPPIVLMLDINMPRMNGFEFLAEFEKIRNSRNDLTSIILMVTSSSDERDRKRAKKFSFVKNFIVKPPSEADINLMIELFGEEVEVE